MSEVLGNSTGLKLGEVYLSCISSRFRSFFHWMVFELFFIARQWKRSIVHDICKMKLFVTQAWLPVLLITCISTCLPCAVVKNGKINFVRSKVMCEKEQNAWGCCTYGVYKKTFRLSVIGCRVAPCGKRWLAVQDAGIDVGISNPPFFSIKKPFTER